MNRNDEGLILGRAMIEGEFARLIVRKIAGDHFSDRRNRKIFHAMCRLTARGEPVDQVTVCEELERVGDLEDVTAYLVAHLAGAYVGA